MRLADVRDSRRLSELLGAVVVLVAAGLSFIYLVKGVSYLGDAASQNSALSFADREVAGGNSIVVDQRAVYEARALIPDRATYRLLTGSDLRNPTTLTPLFVDGWFRYFLMPRRTAADAHWLICYGCDVSRLGAPYHILWRDENRISIGRLG